MAGFPGLKPKEDKFFLLLEKLSEQAASSALHLKAFIESADAAEKAVADRAITESKAKAKDLSSRVTMELCRTYITPFDREDIQDFSFQLYKIPKIIEKIKNRLSAHQLSCREGDFLRQIDLVVQEAHIMQEMVRELVKGHDSNHIVAKVEALQNLEHQGDIVLGDLLISLFRNNADARDMILRKDIYDMLEKVIDRYRDAAGVALQIVLKHN